NGNVIGGASYLSNGYLAGAGNLVSGQYLGGNTSGISIGGGTGGQVYGNFIGTDVTRTVALPNAPGLRVQMPNTIVGGPNGLGNLISGNTSGVLFDSTATGAVIQGNLVGTDVTGTTTIGTDGHSLGNFMEVQPSQMTIGGTAPGDGNVFAG